MLKIKQKDVAKLREDMLKEQKGICPLCQLPIKKEEAVLDHCHTEGYVRTVLHRHCNVIEGKFINWYRCYGKPRGVDIRTLLHNLADYQSTDYSGNPFHYLHKTPQDKAIKGLKRRLKRAKRHTTKQRLQAEIDAILKGGTDD